MAEGTRKATVIDAELLAIASISEAHQIKDQSQLIAMGEAYIEQMKDAEENFDSSAFKVLYGHARSLDAAFHQVFQMAMKTTDINKMEKLMMIAGRCQRGSMSALRSISIIKNPRQVTFIDKQNNLLKVDTRSDSPQEKQLPQQTVEAFEVAANGEELDSRREAEAAGSYIQLEALGI